MGWAGTQGGANGTSDRGPDSPGDRPHAVGVVEYGFALVAMAEAHTKDAARAEAVAGVVIGTEEIALGEQPASSPEAAFIQGYRDFGGRPEWERHFVDDVLPCEGSQWSGYYGSPYFSRAQFSGDTWIKVIAALNTRLGPAAPDDPYYVGAAVAWWSNAIADPGGSGGWPTCWHIGEVP